MDGPDRDEGDAQPDPIDFDWGSPRWREPEAGSAQDEGRRRFRGDAAPRQRGAIDAESSIPFGRPPIPPDDEPHED